MEKSIKKLCYLALFCAIAIVLSYVESLIPLYLGAPGAKLGLANVVTLTLLLCFGLFGSIQQCYERGRKSIS